MSHIPKNNPPKQFCERSFEQGDRKWQQDELELVLELVIRVWGRKKECMGARISGGGPPWAHEAVGRALHPRGKVVGPLVSSLFHKSSNILEKSYLIFRAFGELLFFEVFLYCTDNQITDRKLFIFI